MKKTPIAKLERRFQAVIEGASTRLFPKTIVPRDIAIALARAMEDSAESALQTGAKPVVHDLYRVYLQPKIAQRILEDEPDLPALLAEVISNLCRDSGYQLGNAPEILILEDGQLNARQVSVVAERAAVSMAPTAKMDALPADENPPQSADDATRPAPPD